MKTAQWIESVHLHDDVLKENPETDIFALDLGPLADGAKSVAPVYRDAESFFRASYLTGGLQSLFKEVLTRLSGKGGAPVLKLITPFGGGKSHTMAALFHAAQNRSALDVVPEAKNLPRVENVRCVVIDGQFHNAQQGKEFEGVRANTLWGWIASKLGGKKGYEAFRANDESRVAPGGDDLVKLLGDGPNLILLDEVLEYLINAGGVKVLKTDLREQTLNFLKELTVAAANCPRTVVVLALPSSQPRETMEHSQLLATLDHFVGRKDQLREPVEQDEVLKVIQRRLLKKMPDESVANMAAIAYSNVLTQMKKAYAQNKHDEQQAEEEGITLRDRIKMAYPFHPALLDVMRQRWCSLPEYQRTRGALRFLAACLRAQHRTGKSSGLLGPGDVLLSNHDVRRALIKELGLMNRFDPVFESDLVGVNARAKKIDERRARENPSEVGKNVAQRVATVIFLYSFGGLRRESSGKTEVLPPGITEPELLTAIVGPEIDGLTAKGCLAELVQQCVYLHTDGARYCFKQDPNVKLLIDQEAEAVARDDGFIMGAVKDILEDRIAGHNEAIIWPENSGGIPDKQPLFQLAFLPFSFVLKTDREREALAKELCEKCGNELRKYRNGLGLAIPAADQVEALKREVRFLLAIERIKTNRRKHNLTKDQEEELGEREKTHSSAVESSLLKLYNEVWLPQIGGGLSFEKISVSGRPLQTTLNEKKQARIFERCAELIMVTQKRVFSSLEPRKIVELFKLGEGTPGRCGVGVAEVLQGFFSFLAWPRLEAQAVVTGAIVKGVRAGLFGYYTGSAPELGPDGKFQVAVSKVICGNDIAAEEIDLESGFIMMPSAIPVAVSTTPPAGGTALPPAGPGSQPGGNGTGVAEPGGGTKPQPPSRETVVDITFRADRNRLFGSWDAIANLADMAGEVTITVHAECPKGFDKSKLENGVKEPLREADLIS